MDAIAFIKNHAGLFVLALAVLALPMAAVAISDDSDATAEPETVTIKFDCNGGTAIADLTVEKGTFLGDILSDTAYAPEKEGYIFFTWCSDKALNEYAEYNVLVTKDMTLYAKYFANDETMVAFVDMPSQLIDTYLIDTYLIDYKIVKIGNAVAKPSDPVKSGYKFAGWYTADGQPYDFDTPVTDQTIISAGWEKADTILGLDQATFALLLVICIALLAVVAIVMLLFVNPVLAAVPAVAAVVFAIIGFLTKAFSYL